VTRSSLGKIVLLVVVLLLHTFLIGNDALASAISEAPRISDSMSITTCVSPDSCFGVVIELIRSASRAIDLEIYAVDSPWLIDNMTAAINRGVKATIILEKRALGFSQTNLHAASVWTAAGAIVYWASTQFAFTHAKFMVVDNQTVMVESANWSKNSLPRIPTNKANREWGIVIANGQVAAFYDTLFQNDRKAARPYSASDGQGKPPTKTETPGQYQPKFSSQTFTGNFTVQPVVSPDNYVPVLSALLRVANSSLDLQQLELRQGGVVSMLLLDVLAAKTRGALIRISVDNNEANKAALGFLSSRGVEARLGSKTLFARIHNKGVIIDQKIVLVSSQNWSANSLENNREVGIIIFAPAVALYYQRVFDSDWASSEIFTFTTSPTATIETTASPGPGKPIPGLPDGPVILGIVLGLVTVLVITHVILSRRRTET